MQKFVVGILCLAVLAGCSSSRQSAGGVGIASDPAMEKPAVAAAGVRTPNQPQLDRDGDGIASLPDRGELVAYREDTPVQRSRAYTWRPVDVSEEHALRAIGGELVLPAPDGQQLRLRYERHIEHPDGNWTWVGRPVGAAPGTEAIITFGDKAVFGSIPYGSKPPLRLTTGGGRIWMMQTDGNAIAGLPGANPKGTDVRLPPKRHMTSASGAQGGALRTAVAATVQAVSASAPTVDLLIGYTSTFASRLGGQSQANTRLTYLVDVANQTLSNSQVDAQVRLVKTLQVSYPDATGNDTALYALTGCTETSCTQVDPALQPLHDARDQYGADAVSLVRNFNDPENGGCGIAWLIGGAQTSITPTDEYAAMSVVSDSNGLGGPGSFPDNGYVCRDETLAHEIGHNLGSAHDVDTANGDDNVLQASEYGRYPYSFGYKTASGAGNFFTVMAYGDSGQTSNRVYSNPQVTTCGPLASPIYACGVADQADNARSLRLTIPIIAAFRTAPSAMPDADFNGDGVSDLWWRNSSSGGNVAWYSANISTPQTMTGVAVAWKIAGTGDFDGDGHSDVLWRNESSGANTIWRSGNAATATPLAGVPGTAWAIAGVGDFDNDQVSDILWRNETTGANRIWKSGNAATLLPVSNLASTAWKIVGVGDFDGNGIADILWRNAVSGANTIWKGGNSSTTQGMPSITDLAWQIVGVGDFNADGSSDILWRHTGNGSNTIWRSGSAGTVQTVASVAVAWKVGCVADFNGDGASDIFWRNDNGANAIWRSGNVGTPQSVALADPVWKVTC